MATARAVRQPARPVEDTGRVSLYIRIARVLRAEIQSGKWRVGQQLPAIPDLCAQFQGSRNTVRQALTLLIDNGLVSSTRGSRAVVRATVASPTANLKIVGAINDPFVDPPIITITMVQRAGVPAPPTDLLDGVVYPRYQRFKKVHAIDERPYVLADFYVAQPVADAFPAGADEQFKIDRLLLEQGRVRIVRKRQTITTGHADEELARALDCDLGEAVVHVRRWWHGSQDALVCASVSSYLASFFVFEVVDHDPYRSVAKVGHQGALVRGRARGGEGD